MDSYAKKYNLLQHINFNSEVVSVEKKEKGTENVYKVTVKRGDEMIENEFGCLIIASGIFNSPNIPSI